MNLHEMENDQSEARRLQIFKDLLESDPIHVWNLLREEEKDGPLHRLLEILSSINVGYMKDRLYKAGINKDEQS